MTSTGSGRPASGENCLLLEQCVSAKDSDKSDWAMVGYHTLYFSATHYNLM